MDEIDKDILEELKINARATASDISKKVNLSIPAVAERIKKLETYNIIEKYTVKLNRIEQGYSLLAFIFVDIDKTENILPFREKIVTCKNVLECHHIAGNHDYLLKVLVKNSLELEDFLMNTLKQIKGIASTDTIISLSTLKDEINI